MSTTKVKAIADNLPEKFTAHAVRRLCTCAHCEGIGDRDLMVHGTRGHDADLYFHTGCYIKRYRFSAVMRLPRSERDKFRVRDLTVPQMRKLLETR